MSEEDMEEETWCSLCKKRRNMERKWNGYENGKEKRKAQFGKLPLHLHRGCACVVGSLSPPLASFICIVCTLVMYKENLYVFFSIFTSSLLSNLHATRRKRGYNIDFLHLRLLSKNLSGKYIE